MCAVLLGVSFGNNCYSPQVSYYHVLWFYMEFTCIIYKLSLTDSSSLQIRGSNFQDLVMLLMLL